jgi:membrane associated rhomboid family serine protease
MEESYFTYAAIAVTVIISIIGFNSPAFIENNIFSTYYILKKYEYFRIISSMFLHADWGHLILNMFSFYSFSTGIEQIYGFKIAILIYLGSGIGGGMLSLAVNRNIMEYRALGASGAVSGIIFSSVFLIPDQSVMLFILPVPMPAWVFAILFILASIYGIGKNSDNIGHDAHLGGALTGIIISALIFPEIVLMNYILLAGLIIPTIIFFVFRNKIESFIRSL